VVFLPFGGGGEVGVDGGEVGEALEGAPGAAAGALLDFDGADVAFGLVVRPGDGQVGDEPEDHVVVAVESSDEGAGFAGEVMGVVVVVGGAFGGGTGVVVEQGVQGVGVEVVGAGDAGVVGGGVRGGQGLGHGQCPELTGGVGVGEGP